MKPKQRHSGLTLTEMTVVIAVVALLTALSLPAVRSFFYSMAAASNTKALISASLASARAIAAKEQRYAGIRFQKAGDPNNVLNAPQYMIFIVYEEIRKMKDLTVGFRAVEGIQPIKLSDEIGVINTSLINADVDISTLTQLTNATAFSIIFSPSGKLVIHDVRVRNRNGETNNSSKDDVFNTKANVDIGIGMFYQDDYPGLGLDREPSQKSFIIYEKDKFRQAFLKGKAFSNYLQLIPEMIRINPYTGTIINEQ